MLTILAGEAKGRKLKTLPNAAHLRPILARIKKSVFDIITPTLPESRFLDLYAGTGAVGIEALSRGAKFTTFVEMDRRSIGVLKSNLENLKYTDRSKIYTLNATESLKPILKPFELIFMGPPYKDDNKQALQLVNPTLLRIIEAELLSPNGIIIAQHHQNEKVAPQSPEMTHFRQEKYGDSRVSFFKWKQK